MQLVIQEQVALKFILKTKTIRPIKSGMPFLPQENRWVSNLPDWLQGIPCDWKWDIVYMEMILTIRLLRWKQDLGWITRFSKPFVGREAIEKKKKEGIQKKLVGFEMVDKGIPRHGYEIKDFSGMQIGEVTSGTQSPSLNKAIGLGYVRETFSSPDAKIYIKVRDKLLHARVVKLPFIS